jgi:hypothetical protein
MKKIIYILLLTLFQGNASGADTPLSQQTIATFLAIHNKYCDAVFASNELRLKALSSNAAYKALDGFNDVYEKKISTVSYAVSPEENGCTTDIKLKETEKNTLYFSFQQLNAALLANGYKQQGEKNQLLEQGIDDHVMVKVMEQKYMSPNKNITTLMFPLEKENQYYMTFFADFSNVEKK